MNWCFFQTVLASAKHIFHMWRVQKLSFYFCRLKKARTVRAHFLQAQNSVTSWFAYFTKFVWFCRHFLRCKQIQILRSAQANSQGQKKARSFHHHSRIREVTLNVHVWQFWSNHVCLIGFLQGFLFFNHSLNFVFDLFEFTTAFYGKQERFEFILRSKLFPKALFKTPFF